ncbi:MAG: M15 family metallopeptidase [Atopobiaceae bacterium]|nr:M15 family metallopeptidase [Atopobiaceae bacterium]
MRFKAHLITVLVALVVSFGLVSCGQANTSVAPTNSASSSSEKATDAGSASSSQVASNAELSADEQKAFYVTEITDDIFARIKGKSFKDDCTLPREDLRYLHVLHKDKDGKTHEGEMIVNKHIAEDVLDILRELYKNSYPIQKIRLVDEYDADDERSMEDNNSSCFNFRFISHTNRISNHGLGLAVDINTLYNPYTKVVDGKRIIEPVTAEPYLDRNASFDYKITKDDLCYKLFIEHGFEWGGEWPDRKDYQHFAMPDSKIAEWYPENVEKS